MSDNLFNCTQEKTEEAHGSSSFPDSLQQMSDYSEIIKIETRKYLMSKLLYDSAKESLIIGDNEMDKNLSQQILDFFMLEEVDSDLNGLTLLDLKATKTFSYFELQQLKNITENRLAKFANEVLKYEGSFNGCETADVEDKLVLEYKKKLSQEEDTYLRDLSEEKSQLLEIIQLKTQVLPEVANNKLLESELTIKMNNLKSSLLLEKARVNIFMETEKSLQAYKELIKDMEAHKIALDEEIKDLQLLKEKYRQVHCKEFESILKSYIQHKRSLEKRKILYDQLNHK